MKVKVKYFAAMRELANKTEEIVETNAQSPIELYDELKNIYDFQISMDHLKVAINDEYVDFTNPINELDTIVFIPPVAGG